MEMDQHVKWIRKSYNYTYYIIMFVEFAKCIMIDDPRQGENY